MQDLGIILLAAGQGTRMKSALPKVLHDLGGKALFLHALGTARRLDPGIVAVVVGHGADAVQRAYAGEDVLWVIQQKQLGTGHAVLCVQEAFHGFDGEVVILSGDVPLIQEKTLRRMIEHHRSQRAAVQIALQRRRLGDVVVDTANRLQGREFDVVLAIHPLSGRTDASAFHLDAGRLCVLASRHRQCCVFVGRAGAARLLNDYPPPGNAVLRMHKDPELDGWEAHARFLEHLAAVRLSGG